MTNRIDSDTQSTENKNHGDISLHIERLVLNGFAYSLYERGELQNALHQQLTALIAQGGLGDLIGGGLVPSLRAEGIRISSSTAPNQVGAMVAGSIFNSLRQKL